MFIVEIIYQKVKCFHGVYQKVFGGDEKGKLHCSYWNWKFWSIKHQLDIISSDVHSSIKKKKKNYDHKPEDFLKLSLAPMAHSYLYSGLFEQY